MKQCLAALVLSFLIGATALSAPELQDVSRISGQHDLPGLSVSEQKILLDSLKQQGPQGRLASLYYIPGTDPVFTTLVPEMVARLYRMSAHGSEANCYWTSLFAVGALGLPERYMDLKEYDALASSPFFERVVDGEWKTGDVLRLKRPRGGVETHSVVYLGDISNGGSTTHLVLSKNGPQDGPFVVMSLADLSIHIYPNSQVYAVYRRR